MATLYIHIGTAKTGTTAIQDFLYLNENELEKNGVLHPHIEVNGMQKKFKYRRNGNFLVYNSSLRGEPKEREEEIYRAGFKAIGQAAQKSKKIVISDESIWIRQTVIENFWQKIKDDARDAGCEIKVIVYLRRQDLYLQSVWNQTVKYKYSEKTFQQFIKNDYELEKRHPDYYKTLTGIAEQIGKENVIVRVYEKGILMRSGGIYQDFLEAMGEPMRQEYQIPERFNERLDGNYIEIRRIINHIPECKEMASDFIYRPMSLANNLKQTEKVSYFSYEEQLEFLKKYEKTNQRVAEEFLGRKDGALFTEDVEKLSKWEINHDTLPEDIILFFTEVILIQQQKIDMEQQRIKILERELHNPLIHIIAIIRNAFTGIKKICKKIFH